jgi:hypothetical protein
VEKKLHNSVIFVIWNVRAFCWAGLLRKVKRESPIILTVVPSIFHNPVEENQLMLKGVVSNFLLCSLNYPDMFRHPNAIFKGVTRYADQNWSSLQGTSNPPEDGIWMSKDVGII